MRYKSTMRPNLGNGANPIADRSNRGLHLSLSRLFKCVMNDFHNPFFYSRCSFRRRSETVLTVLCNVWFASLCCLIAAYVSPLFFRKGALDWDQLRIFDGFECLRAELQRDGSMSCHHL